MNWLEIKKEDKIDILTEVAKNSGLPPFAIEKDWWMVQTLRLIFQMDIAEKLIFKGGSSLSKAWGLIERFSEDIDLALDSKFLGFSEDISRTQVSKLRHASFKYIYKSFYPSLIHQFKKAGFQNLKIQMSEIKSTDQDPLIIEIYYPFVIEQSFYIQPRILLEIGSRSLREPFTHRQFCSIVGEHFRGKPFADTDIKIPCVNPERTYLEKLFLLHEEFQRPNEKIRAYRLSRHLYDIEKLSKTVFAVKAIENKELYKTIVAHRKRFSKLSGVDYTSHFPPNLNPLPHRDLTAIWKRDYKAMQEQMIYGNSLSFEKLLSRIKQIVKQINQLNW